MSRNARALPDLQRHRWTPFYGSAASDGMNFKWSLGRTPGAREVAEVLKKRILAIQKLCRISAALRQDWNGGSDFVGFLVVRNEHHRRDASLFSIAVQFPKLDVGGSIPVSRSVLLTIYSACSRSYLPQGYSTVINN